MRVTVHPAGEDACGLYRMVEPARVLAYQGADVDCTRTVAWRFSRTDDDRPYRLVDQPTIWLALQGVPIYVGT